MPNKALNVDGSRTVRLRWHDHRLGRYETIYAYGDTAEDREMLELAHRKFYRWEEISSWEQVTAYSHPPSG